MTPEPRARALVGNAADEEQVRSATATERRRHLNASADLRAVLDTAQGRRVLARILEYTGALPIRPVFRGSDSHTNYEAGRQDVGAWLLSELTHAKPDASIDVIRELLKETE